MLKEDEILKEIFQSLEVEVEPPAGAKQRIYENISYESTYLTGISEKLFKLMIPIWFLISILMTIFAPTIAF